MIFGITAMILVGVLWIIWGYMAGVVARRNLNMGVLIAASAVLGVVICICSIGVLLLLDGSGVPMRKELLPLLPDFSNCNILLVMLLVGIAGIFNFNQLLFMGQAMKSGPNGIIWSIVQAGFIVPFAVGIIFFKEPFTWTFAISIALVIASLVIFAVTADNSSKGHWMLMTFLSFGATCICQSFQYIPSNIEGVDEVSSVWRTLSYFIGLTLGFFIALLFSKEMRQDTSRLIKNKYTWFYAGLIDIEVVFSGYVLLYPGMDAMVEAGIGAIASQIMTASGIVAFEIYALAVLKEKRKPMQVLALLLCLASIVAVCF